MISMNPIERKLLLCLVPYFVTGDFNEITIANTATAQSNHFPKFKPRDMLMNASSTEESCRICSTEIYCWLFSRELRIEDEQFCSREPNLHTHRMLMRHHCHQSSHRLLG